MDSHTRQKFLNPLTLRMAQIFFDLSRSHPVITDDQIQRLTPFFIIGSGRSGTTLLRSVLQRHPAINIPPESMGRIPNCVKKYYRYGGLDWNDLVFLILGEFSSFDTFSLWELNMNDVQKHVSDLSKNERSLARVLDLIYKQHGNKHKPEATMWGDKSPFNTLRLKWLDRVFPNARYIHIIRDGRDVVHSYLDSGLITDIEKACRRWNLSLENVEKFKTRKKEDVYEIKYESFVSDPYKTAKALCSFLGISFDDNMLNERPIDLGDNQRDHMRNVNKPINQDSIGKWKEGLTEDQKQHVYSKLKKNLTAQGYLE